MDKWFHLTHYNGCNYLSMLGLKLIEVQVLYIYRTWTWSSPCLQMSLYLLIQQQAQICLQNDISLQWHHNGFSKFRRRLKKTSKLRVTGLCAGNSLVTGDFPAQMASNVENVSIWWRHHRFRFQVEVANNNSDATNIDGHTFFWQIYVRIILHNLVILRITLFPLMRSIYIS